MKREEAESHITQLMKECFETACGTEGLCTCGRVTDRLKEVEELLTKHFGLVRWKPKEN